MLLTRKVKKETSYLRLLLTELHDEIHKQDREIKQFKKEDEIIKLIEKFFEGKQGEKK
jgi:hypothetical protein